MAPAPTTQILKGVPRDDVERGDVVHAGVAEDEAVRLRLGHVAGPAADDDPELVRVGRAGLEQLRDGGGFGHALPDSTESRFYNLSGSVGLTRDRAGKGPFWRGASHVDGAQTRTRPSGVSATASPIWKGGAPSNTNRSRAPSSNRTNTS